MANKKENTGKKPQTQGKKKEKEVLDAIEKVNPVKEVENVVKVPEEDEKATEPIAAPDTIIEEAKEILDNAENLEKKIEEHEEEMEKMVEEEIRKTEKIIEMGRETLNRRRNNNHAFTEIWNGTTMY